MKIFTSMTQNAYNGERQKIARFPHERIENGQHHEKSEIYKSCRNII